MALFHGVINSKALMKDTTLSMIVPSDDRKNIGFQGQPQLLILLHGAGGSNYTWSKYSSIERYTEPLNLIVLIPNIEFSFGFNMSNGLNYQSYLGEELLQWAEKTFGLKLDRETTTIAGQSMGGGGCGYPYSTGLSRQIWKMWCFFRTAGAGRISDRRTSVGRKYGAL